MRTQTDPLQITADKLLRFQILIMLFPFMEFCGCCEMQMSCVTHICIYQHAFTYKYEKNRNSLTETFVNLMEKTYTKLQTQIYQKNDKWGMMQEISQRDKEHQGM